MGACTTTCRSGLLACSGACVDTTTDRANCGGCGMVCSGGRPCVGGSCMGACPTGTTACRATCSNTQVDPNNCGSCGVVCGAGFGCLAGRCQPLVGYDGGSCASPSAMCGAVCTDLRNSANNCGSCGNVCAADRVCAVGMCLAPCTATQVRCGAAGTCTDTRFDVMNCGACGNVCAMGQYCVSGRCGTMPPLYHGLTPPAGLTGCTATGFNAMAPTALGGYYPYNMGDSNACRAWKLAATVCVDAPTMYVDTNNWQCTNSGGFTDPAFGTYCHPPGTQYSCSSCPGACNATPCSYMPLSLRNCSGLETAQP